MTKPTITFGHGFLDDCSKLTGLTLGDWTETDSGGLLSSEVSVDDYFVLTRTTGATEAYLSYPDEGGADNLTLSSTVYTTIYWRYETSNQTMKAKIVLVFSDATTQTVLPESSSIGFTAGFASITTGKTIDHIRLYANAAAGILRYDFVLICKGIFTFPNTQHGLEFSPPPRYAIIPIPSRITDITQSLGSESATVTCSCDLDLARLGTTSPVTYPICDDWRRPQGVSVDDKTDVIKGEVFMDIAHNSSTEPFQWLDTGKQQFKVTLDTLRFPEHSDSHTLDLTFKEYSRSSKSNETYVDRFGLNL